MKRQATFTVANIAERWNCSHSSVLTLIDLGLLPAIDISTNPATRSRYVVSAEALEAFEAKRTTRPPEPATARRKKRVSIPAGGIVEFFK